MTVDDEAAREGAALVALSDRGVLAVAGPHRQKFLHNVLSNDVEGREPGQGCRAALMDVKGHQLAWMRVLVAGDEVLLEMPAAALGPVEQALLHYKVGAPVRFAPRPTAVLGLLGPAAREVLARAGYEVPDLAGESHVTGSLAGHAVRIARAGDLPAGGFVVHAAPEAADAIADSLRAMGATDLGPSALDALRVEEGRAWWGIDVTEENLLHETGLLGEYHSPTKGCYIGQEVVARLEARGGNVNKMLRGLRLEAPVPAGTSVTAGGKDVGRVTTAAVSKHLGPVAMGYVHRSHFVPGTAVTVAGVAATVELLPLRGAST